MRRPLLALATASLSAVLFLLPTREQPEPPARTAYLPIASIGDIFTPR